LAAPGQTPLGATKTHPRQQNDRGSPSNPSESHSKQSKISKQLQTAKNQPTSNITQKSAKSRLKKANKETKAKQQPLGNPSPEDKDIIAKDIRRKDHECLTHGGVKGCNSATLNFKDIASYDKATGDRCWHLVIGSIARNSKNYKSRRSPDTRTPFRHKLLPSHHGLKDGALSRG